MMFRGQRLLFVYFRIQPKTTIKRTPEGVSYNETTSYNI
jgi:hypothetical protein